MTKARTLADNFAADINGITAGTGITGGGTSGTVTITNQMATTIDAKGDLVVGTGADAFGRLAVASTAGYVLTVDSAQATGLKWAAAASGAVIQVVNALTTSTVTVATTSLTDTGVSATITPTSTSNKILVIVSQSFYHRHFNGDTAAINLILLRGATTIADYQNQGFADVFVNPSISGVRVRGVHSFAYLDSPATTSSITYKTQGAPWSIVASSDAVFQVNNNPSTITLIEVTP